MIMNMKEFILNLLKGIFQFLVNLFTSNKDVDYPSTYGTMINVNNTVQNKKWDYVDMTKFLLSQELHIDNILLNIVENTKILDKLSPEDIEYQAILVKMAPHVYTLYARKGALSPTTLCHELKHLEQYELKKLELLKSKGYKWLGKEYPASYPYDKRPWEIEAFGAQSKLFRVYKKFKRNNENEKR